MPRNCQSLAADEARTARSDQLRARRQQLREEAAALEQRRAAAAAQHHVAGVAGTDKIKLNVGGEKMMALRATLTQFPSKLAALFSGRWEVLVATAGW